MSTQRGQEKLPGGAALLAHKHILVVISDSHALISSDPVSTISEASGLVSRVLADPQMAGAVSSGSFRISPVDRLRRRIDPVVFATAEEILPLAVSKGSASLRAPSFLSHLFWGYACTH